MDVAAVQKAVGRSVEHANEDGVGCCHQHLTDEQGDIVKLRVAFVRNAVQVAVQGGAVWTDIESVQYSVSIAVDLAFVGGAVRIDILAETGCDVATVRKLIQIAVNRPAR